MAGISDQINTKTEADDTPLHSVTENGHVDLGTVLLSAGADINGDDKSDMISPGDTAGESGLTQVEEFVELLTVLEQWNGRDITTLASLNCGHRLCGCGRLS